MAGIQKRFGEEGGQDSGEIGRVRSDIIHHPVLLEEIIQNFDPKPGQKYIDATLDGGGHSKALLAKVLPDGKVLGIEWDNDLVKDLESKNIEGLTVVNDSYVNLMPIADGRGFLEADGVLFDLGMSSWHVDWSGKGFSFQKDEPLDMRYNTESGETAAEIVNTYQEERLADLIYQFGEERLSRQIAKGIVMARRQKRILTTYDLVEVIKESVPFAYRKGRIHFATRTFQALRIAVNHELENITSGLTQAMEVLKSGGKLMAISFHSLEDRIVKNFFREQKQSKKATLLNKKPILATLEETVSNPRSRSAKLRILIKS